MRQSRGSIPGRDDPVMYNVVSLACSLCDKTSVMLITLL